MGIFKRTKKRMRGKSKSPKDIALKLENDFLKKLQKSDDPEEVDIYREIMMERVLGKKKKPEKDRLTETVETLKLLKEAGLVEDPRSAGGGFNWREIIQGIGELGKQAPAIIEQFSGGGQAQPSYDVPAEASHQIEDPRKEAQQKMPRMTLLSQTLIWRVHNKTPDQVADMLLEQYDKMPVVKELVDGFCETPDEQFGEFLNTFTAKYPDLAPFMRWLNEQKRLQWFGDCVRAVRAKMGAGQQSQASSGGI